MAGAAASSSPWSNIVPSPQILSPNVEGLVKSHLAAIDKHLTTTPSTQTSASSNNAMALISSLQEGIKDAAAVSNSGLTTESTLGYSNAFSLLQSNAHCSRVNNGLAASARDVCAFASIVAGMDVVEGWGLELSGRPLCPFLSVFSSPFTLNTNPCTFYS